MTAFHRTSNEITIVASPQEIFRYAAATEKWPEYLPHYRYVRVLQRVGQEQIVEMAAWRNFLPVRWIARQRNDPDRPAISFRHMSGWARGMDVQWCFEALDGATRVTIDHRLDFRFPIAPEFIGRHVVSDFFIKHIAGKTLARMKALAEHHT